MGDEALNGVVGGRSHQIKETKEKLIHHSDARFPYVSLRFTEDLTLEGMRASIGTVGDAHHNLWPSRP